VCDGLTATGGRPDCSDNARDLPDADVRLLFDHPSADPAALMTQTDTTKVLPPLSAALAGERIRCACCSSTRLPNPAAMFHRSAYGDSALIAAKFAARGGAYGFPTQRCTPPLFLLRRVSVGPQLCDAQEAHMTEVMEALWGREHGEPASLLFDVDQPDGARDECVTLLLDPGTWRGCTALQLRSLGRQIKGERDNARDYRDLTEATLRREAYPARHPAARPPGALLAPTPAATDTLAPAAAAPPVQGRRCPHRQ
jgi:hypothetical protein